MLFTDILKLYNYEHLNHKEINDIQYIKPLNYSRFSKFLSNVLGLDFSINVDNDGDGAVSAKLIRYLLLDFGAKSVTLYYQSTPHVVDEDMIQTCKEENRIAIILDSSSNDINIIKKAEECKVKTLIIDHHELNDDMVNFYKTLTYTEVLSSKMDYDILRDMSCGMYIYFLMHYFYLERGKLPYEYFDLAVLSLASDVCPMDNYYHRQIMKKYLNNPIRNRFISAFTNKYNYFNKSLLSMTISPNINALFRTKSYETLHKLMIDYDLPNTLKVVREIYKQNKKILDIVMSQLTIYDYGYITYANMLDYPATFIASNYTGLLANKILDRYGKPCIVTCAIDTDILKGSIRSKIDLDINNTLKNMPSIIKSGGHTNAHGYTIYKNGLEDLIYTFNSKAANNNQIDKSIKLETIEDIKGYYDCMLDIATFNEYSGSNVEPITFTYRISAYDNINHEKNYSKVQSLIEIITFTKVKPGDILYIKPTISNSGVQFIGSLV